ncbi:kinase-like domain-containing protein [Gigaspora rosea]|uniref:Kinase-like domain-containing protein n=1 Tax=Gigaspora rosea TaxID=44941 RepID=A0A397VKW3_9GLOM|nr:kinase-like domain-containing protein [Gigaspora rosea]
MFSSYITDFGLCKSVSQGSNSEDLIGVLPYIAPELLRASMENKKIIYTQQSDVYSFGIVMSEVFTGYPPYYDVPHETKLSVKICRGQKPEIKCEVPPLLLDLMNRCLDIEPRKRPTAEEVSDKLMQFYEDLNNETT